MTTRRDRLISILREYPAAEEAYLHDGRGRVHPAEEIADRIEALDSSDDPLFERVMTASKTFVERFGGTLSFEGALRKMYEEQHEFEIAIVAYLQALTSDTPMSMRLHTPSQLKHAMLQEYIDFMVTVGGLFAVLGVDFADVEQAARDTLSKLDARDESTHVWHPETKTVMKRSKLEDLK